MSTAALPTNHLTLVGKVGIVFPASDKQPAAAKISFPTRSFNEDGTVSVRTQFPGDTEITVRDWQAKVEGNTSVLEGLEQNATVRCELILTGWRESVERNEDGSWPRRQVFLAAEPVSITTVDASEYNEAVRALYQTATVADAGEAEDLEMPSLGEIAKAMEADTE